MNYLLIVFIGIIGVFYYNTIGWMIESWMYNEYYSHGFIVPIVSGYMIWNMRHVLATIEKKPSQGGLGIFMAGILLQLISGVWTIRFLSGLSLILTLAGVIIYVFGWDFMKKIKFPFLFLLFMIPFPFVDIIASPAQTFSAFASTNIANIIGIPARLDGLVIAIPGGAFEVGITCSGINSIISLLTIGALFALILEGSRSMKFTILASAIPLAMAGNILRITSVLAVATVYGQTVALNYFHDFSSLLFFSISLMGLFLVGRCFGRLQFKKIF
ncbi:MAG TPA: exosortase [Candidatus Methanoperedens sp.]|nr:exosortase [Candidatus Methanoperedens sp.]